MNAPRRATIQAVRPDARNLPPAGAPGVVLGSKYRLEQTIARGGMARVWRAMHVTLNRPVAVKFVEAAGATAQERTERFLREAKVAASVRHKNVVDIIDFGTSGSDEPYMVMELLEGETLDQRLVRGTMTNDEVVSVSLQILSGLDAVHRVGIVHRDLKPGNVFLTADDEGVFARLLDFGISQGADEERSSEKMVVGTPEYMSPEQAFGDPLDARSDLYSVGVMMYEMLSGALPFEHPDPQKVVEMVAHETPPDLESLRPDVPHLCAIVERAMARDPGDRFESARDMRRSILEAVGATPDTTGRHMAIPRDSRVSGISQRATPAAGAIASAGLETAGDLDPAPRRASSMPPAPSRGRGVVWIGIALVALVAVAGTIVWALGTQEEAPRAEATPPPAPPPAPVVAPAPVVPEAPVAAVPAPPVEPAPEAEPDPEPVRPRPRGGRPRPRGEGTGAPREGSGGIVRELDF